MNEEMRVGTPAGGRAAPADAGLAFNPADRDWIDDRDWADDAGRRPFLRLTILIVILFWIAQYSLLTSILLVNNPDMALPYAAPRAMVSAIGMLASFGFLAVQLAARRLSLVRRALLAAALAVGGSALHGVVNGTILSAYAGEPFNFGEYAASLLPLLLNNLWTYMSISLIVLSLTYAMDLRDRENRIAALRTAAHMAQLRALRFQLNPHFLFNALNSVASLIAKSRNDEAEAMTEGLSDFLRSTMRMDATGEITLGEEMALQSLYLEIEKARFPDRLKVELDVPDALRGAAIPNLISQPLVENALKHAVARSSGPVTVRIAARQEAGMLALSVSDDGGDASPPPAKGTQIGLGNVSERLRLHFGKAGSLAAGPLPTGGYEAVIRLPLRMRQ